MVFIFRRIRSSFSLLSRIDLNTERSYKTRLNGSDCQSKIPNARIGLVDYQRSYFSTFKFPQLRFERTWRVGEKAVLVRMIMFKINPTNTATGEEFRKLSYPSILRSEIHLSAGKILSFWDISEMIRIKFVNKLCLEIGCSSETGFQNGIASILCVG